MRMRSIVTAASVVALAGAAQAAVVFTFSEPGFGGSGEGGTYFGITNNGTTAVSFESQIDLVLGNTTGSQSTNINVYVNETNFNPASNATIGTGAWSLWGSASVAGPHNFSSFSQVDFSGGTLVVDPGETVGLLVRSVEGNRVRYKNPGPGSALPMTGVADDLTLRFYNGVNGGSGVANPPTYGTPRGLYMQLYAVIPEPASAMALLALAPIALRRR